MMTMPMGFADIAAFRAHCAAAHVCFARVTALTTPTYTAIPAAIAPTAAPSTDSQAALSRTHPPNEIICCTAAASA